MATKHTFDVYTEESVFCIIFVYTCIHTGFETEVSIQFYVIWTNLR